MKKVLIVTPYFPPLNTADMQRVRLSIPYYRKFGWEPLIMTVEPDLIEGVRDELLLKTLPEDIEICRVKALPNYLTKYIGINSPGIRAIPNIYKTGLKLLRDNEISLVFFSTTCFHLLFLGRLWKNKTGVPYLIDMQDPWFSDIDYSNNFNNSFKYKIDRMIHKRLESWTMKRAGGIISVSETYIETLKNRYRELEYRPSETIIFGTSDTDFKVLENNFQENSFFDKNDKFINGVYVGRAGNDMKFALSIIFKALRKGLENDPQIFKKISLYFIGTDYAPKSKSRKTVEPVAEEFGVAEYVREFPRRIPYFETLQVIKDSDFLIIPGSEEPQYSASKIYPYILAEKPMISVFHTASSVVNILNELDSGEVVSFDPGRNSDIFADKTFQKWKKLLESIPFTPVTNWSEFKKYTAKELTSRQCKIFDEVVN